MARPLINLTEFNTYFAHDRKYMEKGSWPEQTRLLYTYTVMDDDGLEIEKQPWIKQEYDGNHKEISMLDTIKPKFERPQARKIELVIYLSNSPCSDCTARIIAFKDKLEISMKKSLTIRINFSNFYLISWQQDKINFTGHGHADGLVNLRMRGVQLTIFDGDDDWKRFFDDIGVPKYFQETNEGANDRPERDNWFEIVRQRARREREEKDKDILKQIEEKFLELRQKNLAKAATPKS